MFLRLSRAVAALALLAAAASAQTTPYVLDEVRGQSNFTFSGTTSIGPIQGNPSNQFQIDGIADLLLDPAGGPFSLGQFNGGFLYTVPSTLNARIPNPIPFLPPLATIDIIDPAYRADSGPFTIDPAGNFTTMVTLTALHGRTRISYLGTTTEDTLVGSVSDPTQVTGRIYVSGTQTILDMPIDANFHSDDPATGISSDVRLVGRILAVSDSAALPAILRVGDLTGGLTGSFRLSQGTPSSLAWLAYGVSGLGDTPISQLGVTLGIRNPVQAGNPQRTDAAGATTWSLPIPSSASGRTVRFQAAQSGKASNIWLSTVL